MRPKKVFIVFQLLQGNKQINKNSFKSMKQDQKQNMQENKKIKNSIIKSKKILRLINKN